MKRIFKLLCSKNEDDWKIALELLSCPDNEELVKDLRIIYNFIGPRQTFEIIKKSPRLAKINELRGGATRDGLFEFFYTLYLHYDRHIDKNDPGLKISYENIEKILKKYMDE